MQASSGPVQQGVSAPSCGNYVILSLLRDYQRLLRHNNRLSSRTTTLENLIDIHNQYLELKRKKQKKRKTVKVTGRGKNPVNRMISKIKKLERFNGKITLKNEKKKVLEENLSEKVIAKFLSRERGSL
jgi:hypothetical protein